MKKIMAVISVLLVMTEILVICSISFYRSPSYSGRTHKIVEIDDTYNEINFSYESYHISKGSIVSKSYAAADVETDKYSFVTDTPSVFTTTGIIYKDTVVGNHTFSCLSRILDVTDNTVLCEDLENTYLIFTKGNINKSFNTSEFDFNAYIGNKELSVLSSDFSYSIADNAFIIKAYVDNTSGIYTSGMKANVSYYESIPLSGDEIYVPSSAVVENEAGVYVYKLVTYNKTKYYEIIPVKITGTYEDYYTVEGELSDGNIIIQPC